MIRNICGLEVTNPCVASASPWFEILGSSQVLNASKFLILAPSQMSVLNHPDWSFHRTRSERKGLNSFGNKTVASRVPANPPRQAFLVKTDVRRHDRRFAQF